MSSKKQTKLTHLDEKGQASMVEVTQKDDTVREAIARGFVRTSREVLNLIRSSNLKKGDAMQVARIAGIMGAKKTHELIPLCHPLNLTKVEVDLRLQEGGIGIECRVVCVGKTGVEMEALTGVACAALTIYDMCKAVDKTMVIGEIELVKKSGGRSGTFVKEAVSSKSKYENAK